MDETEPGKLTIYERRTDAGNVDEYQLVSARWVNSSVGRIGNICFLTQLFQSNREMLYRSICQKLFHKSIDNKELDHPKMPFKKVQIAGDGRCGFR